RRKRVFPEVLLLGGWASSGDVLLRHAECLAIACERVAVGPVAAEEDAALSKEVPNAVERSLVRCNVKGDPAINAAQDFRAFYKYGWALRQLMQIGVVFRARGWIARRICVGQVIEHDAEVRNAIADFDYRCNQGRVGIGGLEHQSVLSEQFKAGYE